MQLTAETPKIVFTLNPTFIGVAKLPNAAANANSKAEVITLTTAKLRIGPSCADGRLISLPVRVSLFFHLPEECKHLADARKQV